MEQLRRIGEVKRETVASEDVTKAHADLETRLSIERQAEEHLRVLLGSRAGTLAEVLEAERELDRVVAAIEQLLGERRFYDHRITTSDIVLSLQEPGAMMRAGLMNPIRSALRLSLEVLSLSVAALIYIVVALVPWGLSAALVLWMAAAFKRRFRDRKGQ